MMGSSLKQANQALHTTAPTSQFFVLGLGSRRTKLMQVVWAAGELDRYRYCENSIENI